MTADRWTQAVRDQLGLGRLLPLGGERDGAWIAERAAAGVLRDAASGVAGVRVYALRIGLADPGAAAPEPVVPPPPSALAPGPLRIEAEVAAAAAEPLPVAADRLRTALAQAANARLGLLTESVDLRVTGLLETTPAGTPAAPEGAGGQTRAAACATPEGAGDEVRVGAVVASVSGVSRLAGAGRGVRISACAALGVSVPGRHVRVEVAVYADHRALDVALAVRRAVAHALADRPTVAVLVTAVDRPR
ncbi:nucleopolyhedrovirus P10 family protein [Streptomyces sp. O3]